MPDTGERTVQDGFENQGDWDDRPTNPHQGHCYYDTASQKPYWFDGADYRDSAGTVYEP
mgnify:FL=1